MNTKSLHTISICSNFNTKRNYILELYIIEDPDNDLEWHAFELSAKLTLGVPTYAVGFVLRILQAPQGAAANATAPLMIYPELSR